MRVDPEENLRMIADSVAFLVARASGSSTTPSTSSTAGATTPATRCAACARRRRRGRRRSSLCDTNGGTLPHEIAGGDARGRRGRPACRVGIHCHNDAECGVANSLAAVAAGATHVQGTLNGYGERCGNANLISIIPNLQLKLGHGCLPALAGLTEAPTCVDELLNFTPDPNQPYVGKNAFAHKGGMHVAGVAADPATFEHIDPAAVGNAPRGAGLRAVGQGHADRARRPASLDEAAAARVVERVKELEHRGYQFEAADGSLELLLRSETGEYEPLFRLESWRVIVEKRDDGRVETEATIKIWVDGERYVRTAEGNGPVHALDRALRDAISETYPHLADIELVNFKVRILDEAKATARGHARAARRLRRHDTWGAIGVHENVIEASLGRAGRLAGVRHAAEPRAATAAARSPRAAAA